MTEIDLLRMTLPAICVASGRIGNRVCATFRNSASEWLLAVKCSISPSNIRTLANMPSHSRTALRTIVSKTGFVSATELLMTCNTSAVALCRSSASFVSLNSRTFSIAITAWSANMLSTSI